MELVSESADRIPEAAALILEAESLTPAQAVAVYAREIGNYQSAGPGTAGPYAQTDPAALFAESGGAVWYDFADGKISEAFDALAAYESDPEGFLQKGRAVFALRYIEAQLASGGEALLAQLFQDELRRKSELRTAATGSDIDERAREAAEAVLGGGQEEALRILNELLAGIQPGDRQAITESFLRLVDTAGSGIVEAYREAMGAALGSGALLNALDRRFAAEVSRDAEEARTPDVPVSFALGESVLYRALRRGQEEVAGVVGTALDRGGRLVFFDRLGSSTVDETRTALETALGAAGAEARSRYRRLERTGDEVPLGRLQTAAKSLGRDYDPKSFVVFAGSGDSSVEVGGQPDEEKRLVFLVDSEVLDVFSVQEILALLRGIATAPVKLREFYREQLGLRPDREGRTIISRDFLETILRIAAAEELVATMA